MSGKNEKSGGKGKMRIDNRNDDEFQKKEKKEKKKGRV